MQYKDFVVGQKYTYGAGAVCECVYADPWIVVMKPDGPEKETWVVSLLNTYKPYVEPKRGTFWLNVYQTPGINQGIPWAAAFDSEKKADECVNRIACIKVPWVEGQGLKD